MYRNVRLNIMMVAGVLILATAAGCTSTDTGEAGPSTAVSGPSAANEGASGSDAAPADANSTGEGGTTGQDGTAADDAATDDTAAASATTGAEAPGDGESPPAAAAADQPEDPAALLDGSGDLGDLGSTEGLSMPNLVGKSVADAQGALSGIEVTYTDLDGATVPGGDQQQVCRQSPEADTDASGKSIVLAVADSC